MKICILKKKENTKRSASPEPIRDGPKEKKQGAKGLLILYGLARVYPTFLAGTLFYANRAPTRDAPTLNAIQQGTHEGYPYDRNRRTGGGMLPLITRIEQ